MALVSNLKKENLERDVSHSIVDSTYSIINNENGKFLQIDTYGSNKRQIRGKKSQSIRLTKDAISQLKRIIDNEF